MISNNVWTIFGLGDHQITFVTLNRFCPLSKPPRVVNHLLFLTDKTNLDGTSSKIKWKIHVFWCIVFYVLKVLLIKEYKIQKVYQFLYFLLFYITSEFTSADIIFNIYWKKIFVTNFRFLMDSPKPTTLFLSLAKVFCWCSLNLENFWFYIWVVVLWLNFTTQMTLRHLLLTLMNKILECKDHQIYSEMLRKICKKEVGSLISVSES